MKRQHYKEDAIIKIPLDGGLWSFARLLRFPHIAFFELRNESGEVTATELLKSNVLFIIAVHKSAVASGRWEKIGKFPPGSPKVEIPDEFMQDFYPPYTCRIMDQYGNIRPADYKECRGLERCAAWEINHVEDRLNDHFAGVPNIWVLSYRLREPPHDGN